MSTLLPSLRRQLERAALDARKCAEAGAHKALEALAVHEPDPYRHMDGIQRELRRKLRAQARQLGDEESRTRRGAYEIEHLVEKMAYDQWHRLLFARFLLENNLLISPEHAVSVSLNDCEDLAQTLGLKDAWAVAARFAAVELPEIFRDDDPAGAVELPMENRKGLIQLVAGLPTDVFIATDSLGWCYQFWQAERKEEINAAGNKIGAHELPAVTQLFTEDYMVDFLLDNTLGAWYAGKALVSDLALTKNAKTEEELRNAIALPECSWKYLRFIHGKNGEWIPAAGTFEGWPKAARQLRCLDPCMGSGHFVVAMFERLVSLRIAEEKLDDAVAIAAVIRDNLFGLEIDPRCTQIGAFNLALAAWRRVGHFRLPPMNLACSGIAPNAKKEDWLKLAGDSDRLQRGMERLYTLFKDAPVLGSLINPRASDGDLLDADFHELQPMLERALAQEVKNDTTQEMAVIARGLAQAAEILAGQFTLVATNVPYLGRSKQDGILKNYCDRVHPDAKTDLGACFVRRSLGFCASGGRSALVTPQGWLFQAGYSKLREVLLSSSGFSFIAKLGAKAFQTPMWDFNVMLVMIAKIHPTNTSTISGLDATLARDASSKAISLLFSEIVAIGQDEQRKNPDFVISLDALEATKILKNHASCVQGLATSDDPQFTVFFWELGSIDNGWEGLLGTVPSTMYFGGRERLIHWQEGKGRYFRHAMDLKAVGRLGGWKSGTEARGKLGILVSQMSEMPVTLYTGEFYDHNASVIVPNNPKTLSAIWAMCATNKMVTEVRKIDQSLKPSNNVFVKVPFDLTHWQQVAAEKYPHGLPKPSSSDPTQWLFNGHPRDSDHPLHVAVARLLCYRWPRQTGSSFLDCAALDPDGLETLADDDGIVTISPAKGETAAAERLRELLTRTYGKDWSATRQEEMLSQVEYAGASLEDWLRNGFFEQHCTLFLHRPFIWHIWDGQKSGFSALVNYHKLTHKNLEKLTYSYLGDWIRRQQAAVDAEEAGSDARLEAAKQLQTKLKAILEGEPPYDIFVRWKSLSKQASGWHPDLNDGVRMNIRPFAAADILRKRVKIKWEKDRGKEPPRDKAEYPWFWGWDGKNHDFAGVGKVPDGNRWNDCHYTNESKKKAREARRAG